MSKCKECKKCKSKMESSFSYTSDHTPSMTPVEIHYCGNCNSYDPDLFKIEELREEAVNAEE
jgi:ferredoxin